tara:strand:- start:332 stop:1036 length:705 start_codon:yes stop_codon:yes gene_type:complete
MSKNKKKILVIAAHPDDETIGCGGALAKYLKEKFQVKVIFLGEGSTCRFEPHDSENKKINAINQRENYCKKALKVLGIKNFEFYNLPCGRFDQIPIIDIAKIVEKEINIFNPSIIFTHSDKDVHSDHRVTFQACLQATRPSINNNVDLFLSFEIISSSERNFVNTFSPNYFIEFDQKALNKKLKAMRCYRSEFSKYPHPRSIKSLKNLAMYRGVQAGCHYAEAFKLVRFIHKKK